MDGLNRPPRFATIRRLSIILLGIWLFVGRLFLICFSMRLRKRDNFCASNRDLLSVRSTLRSVFRIATSDVPLHNGRKPEEPDSLPPHERTADTVRTQSVRRAPCKVPQ
jgi:hypothetical protein